MKRIVTAVGASFFILIGVATSEGAILKSTSVDRLDPRSFSLSSSQAPLEVASRGSHYYRGGHHYRGGHRHYRHRDHHHHYRGHGGYHKHGAYRGYHCAPPVYRHHGYRPYYNYGYGSGFSLYLGF